MLGSAPIGSTPIAAALTQDAGAPAGDMAGTCSLAFSAQATADQPPQPFTVYPGQVVALSMGGVYRPDVYRFVRHTLFSPNGTPSGAIAGTSSLTFGPSGTLSASGALAASQAVTFSLAGTLAGSGAIAGTSALVFSTTAALSGGSGMAGVSALAFSTSATLDGSGALAGTASLAFSTTASADGAAAGLAGNLLLLVGKSYRQRVDDLLWQPYDLARVFPLTVAESLAGQVSVTFSTSAALTGAGALAGTAALVFSASGTFDAPSSPTYTVYPGRVDAYSFGGVYRPDVYRFVRATLWQPAVSTPGVLEGTSALAFLTAGEVTGSGALAGTSALTFTLAATATGAGALTGTSAVVFAASGTLADATAGAMAGTASLAFTPSATVTGGGALAGVSSLSFSATGTVVDGNGLAGTASVVFTPLGEIGGLGALSGACSLNFSLNAAFNISAQPAGGDDKPDARKHPGWDKKRSTLKRSEELRLEDDIRAIYRRLTAAPETAERAQTIVAPVAAKVGSESATLRELARQSVAADQMAVEIEIALRLLLAELEEVQHNEDAAVIAMLLAQVI